MHNSKDTKISSVECCSANFTDHPIIQYLSKYSSLSESEISKIMDLLVVNFYKKGEILLREGQKPELCFFVIKGCVRQYFIIDGEEKTTEIYTEGQPISVFTGSHNKKPSPYFLACLEDCELSVGTTNYEDLEYDPRFATMCQRAAEEELGRTLETLNRFKLNSPEERYLELLRTRPDIVERVPQYYLASYLGIKPESLSRIRKRITKSDKKVNHKD